MNTDLSFTIRQEQTSDYRQVSDLIEEAFLPLAESEHDEHLLVERLRSSDAFIPQLSLVAEADRHIIGFVLMTLAEICSETQSTETLALAPVAVLPAFQHRGVGSALIREAHRRATARGYTSAVVLGNPDFYAQFGYRSSATFGINLPFDVSQEYCMATELQAHALDGVCGTVRYDRAFTEK